jgi:hypothetical protein
VVFDAAVEDVDAGVAGETVDPVEGVDVRSVAGDVDLPAGDVERGLRAEVRGLDFDHVVGAVGPEARDIESQAVALLMRGPADLFGQIRATGASECFALEVDNPSLARGAELVDAEVPQRGDGAAGERTGVVASGCPRCAALAGKGVTKTPEDLARIAAMPQAAFA